MGSDDQKGKRDGGLRFTASIAIETENACVGASIPHWPRSQIFALTSERDHSSGVIISPLRRASTLPSQLGRVVHDLGMGRPYGLQKALHGRVFANRVQKLVALEPGIARKARFGCVLEPRQGAIRVAELSPCRGEAVRNMMVEERRPGVLTWYARYGAPADLECQFLGLIAFPQLPEHRGQGRSGPT